MLRTPSRSARVVQDDEPELVLFSPSIGGHFARSHRLKPDSAKTYGNPARGTACR